MRRHAWKRRLEAAIAWCLGWREIELPRPDQALYGYPGVGVRPGGTRPEDIPVFLGSRE